LANDLCLIPQTFAGAIAQIQRMALEAFDHEVVEKQLCYHTRDHITGVQRRASQLFQVICPYLPTTDDRDRLELLLDLCAVTHDLTQIFVSHQEPHKSRRREAGVSETATIEQLLEFIHILNQYHANDSAHFLDSDLQIIQESIAATICDYDSTEQAIFQPALYQDDQPISPIARILALADIGTLGMEGIAAYNIEGSLLFLEENPDVRSLITHHQIASLDTCDPALRENIRQRLLKRTRFQVNLAKSRLKRSPQEFAAFPPQTIPTLTQEIFRHLTPAVIAEIVSSTPTAEDTTLAVLLNFFQFGQVLADLAT